MDRAPGDSPPSTTGPPDRQILRLLERHLSSDTLVMDTAIEPNPHEPRVLHASFDSNQYPTPIDSVRLDVRWYESGDFSLHYVEDRQDEGQWECRWDRRPNEHNARLHFHHPPDATRVTDLSLPSVHPLDVYSTVATAIEQRVQRLWDER